MQLLVYQSLAYDSYFALNFLNSNIFMFLSVELEVWGILMVNVISLAPVENSTEYL